MTDFHTMKRLSKITVESVTEALREDYEKEGFGLSEEHILKAIGVCPDLQQVAEEDIGQYQHVMDKLSEKVRACCEASENVEESRSMWTSFVYVPDSELERRKQEQRHLQQKQEKFEDAIESNPDFVQKDKHLFVYQDLIEVRLQIEGDKIEVSCSGLAPGSWILYKVDDLCPFLDGLVGFAEATDAIKFDTDLIQVTAMA